jgi:formate--tetrahydrofolate ligase
MLSDIEIAQKAKMNPIVEVARKLGIPEEAMEAFGRYKAKISLNTASRCARSRTAS